MIDFMILALPRSGTTWAANWLTTDNSMCWHDPVTRLLPKEIDKLSIGKKYHGISCTGAWMWSQWVKDHPARKIILLRDINEINASLESIGLPLMTQSMVDRFNALEGIKVPYTDLFESPQFIWKNMLPDIPFDPQRHAELVKMNIEPVGKLSLPDPQSMKRMLEDLRAQL